jgi:hypothetical protein
MIRPEARAALIRWREVLIGAAAIPLGAWLPMGLGLPRLFGLALLAVGGFLVVTGLRRARFRNAADGPGILRTDEGRIAYMGPEDGGTVALDDLTEVAFHRDPATWRLIATTGTLAIPQGAVGADALLDALAPLPGFDGGAMVRATRARGTGPITVWRRDARLALT